MIEEDYVSFETAKLLKEKGFDEYCFRYAESKEIYESGDWMVANVTGGAVGVPTLQMAIKWLREEKKLYVNVWADPKDAENNDFRTIFRTHVYDGTSNYGESEFFTYEEACESSIKYCLENLI